MYKNLLFVFFAILITAKVISSPNIDKEGTAPSIVLNDEQNMSLIRDSIDNPLRGFSSFNFFPSYPPVSEKILEQIQNLVEKELGKYGTVEKLDMCVKTSKGTAIDPTVLIRGGYLSYEIDSVKSETGGILPFVRASLHLKSYVTIDKTKEICKANVWSKSCYLSGDIKENTPKLISESLRNLLAVFISDYSSINKDRPIFYLVAP